MSILLILFGGSLLVLGFFLFGALRPRANKPSPAWLQNGFMSEAMTLLLVCMLVFGVAITMKGILG